MNTELCVKTHRKQKRRRGDGREAGERERG
jgi:hypothetical protein